MKKNKKLEELRKKISKDDRIFDQYYFDLVIRINQLIESKGWNQQEFAEKLGKRPSEISKWVNGGHNLTLKTIAKMEAILEAPLLHIPKFIPVSGGGVEQKTTPANKFSTVEFEKIEYSEPEILEIAS